MQSYKNFLDDLVSQNNIIAVDSLLTHILPTLGEEELDHTIDVMKRRIHSAAHKEVAELMAQKVGVSPDVSIQYVQSRLDDPLADRSELSRHVNNLGEYFGHLLVNALLRGDVEISGLIDQAYEDQYPIDLYWMNHVGNMVNGKEIKRDVDFLDPSCTADLEKIFELAQNAGLKSLLGTGADNVALLLKSKINTAIYATRQAISGPIPSLNQAKLCNPELAIALQQRRAESSFMALYDHLLVWVEDTDLAEVHGTKVKAFREFRMGEDFEYGGVKRESKSFSLDDFDRVLRSGEQYSLKGSYSKASGLDAVTQLFVGLEPESDDPVAAARFYALSQQMLTPKQRLGLDAPEGHTLVMMSLDDALSYEIASIDMGRLEVANQFAGDYFPVDVMIANRDVRRIMEKDEVIKDLGIASGKHWFSEDLFEKLADAELAKTIISTVPAALLHKYIDTHFLSVDEKNLRLAIDNTGYKPARKYYKFDAHKARQLEAAGVILAEKHDGAFTAMIDYGASVNCTLDSYVSAMNIGLWPGRNSSDMQISVKQALTKALQLKKDVLFTAFLKHSGAVSVAPLIKTDPQIRLFQEIFSAEEIRDCLDVLPKKLRDHTFSEDLGL